MGWCALHVHLRVSVDQHTARNRTTQLRQREKEGVCPLQSRREVESMNIHITSIKCDMHILQFSMVAQWLALLPQSKEVLESIPSLG